MVIFLIQVSNIFVQGCFCQLIQFMGKPKQASTSQTVHSNSPCWEQYVWSHSPKQCKHSMLHGEYTHKHSQYNGLISADRGPMSTLYTRLLCAIISLFGSLRRGYKSGSGIAWVIFGSLRCRKLWLHIAGSVGQPASLSWDSLLIFSIWMKRLDILTALCASG